MNRWSKAFLVALRIAVGWHFLYEGLWKMGSDTGAASYATSWYTLHSQLGRLRDDLARMPADQAMARTDAWYDDVVKAFKARKALGEDQKARLAELRDKVKLAFNTGENIDFDWQYVRDEVLSIAAGQEGERFTSLAYLQNAAGPFRPLYRALAPDLDGIERLTAASAQAALDRREREILNHFASAGRPFNPEQRARLAAVRDALKAAIAATLDDPAFRARLEDYRRLRDRVRRDSPGAITPFAKERLDADRKKLDVIAAELLGFVNEPLAELAVQTQNIATVAQLGAGPVPRLHDPTRWIDGGVKWGLVGIGACLLLGLFTPVAAIAAALQLATFYFASPPWPGLPGATTGGHYLYVDRNLIEAIAACLIATTATGRWAGLDAYLYRFADAMRRPRLEPVEVSARRMS